MDSGLWRRSAATKMLRCDLIHIGVVDAWNSTWNDVTSAAGYGQVHNVIYTRNKVAKASSA